MVACARPGGNQTSFLKFGVAIGTQGEPMGIHRGPHWDPWNPWGHHGDPSGPQRDPMGTQKSQWVPRGPHEDRIWSHGDPIGTTRPQLSIFAKPNGARCRSNGMTRRNYRFLRSQMRAKSASIDFYMVWWLPARGQGRTKCIFEVWRGHWDARGAHGDPSRTPLGPMEPMGASW